MWTRSDSYQSAWLTLWVSPPGSILDFGWISYLARLEYWGPCILDLPLRARRCGSVIGLKDTLVILVLEGSTNSARQGSLWAWARGHPWDWTEIHRSRDLVINIRRVCDQLAVIVEGWAASISCCLQLVASCDIVKTPCLSIGNLHSSLVSSKSWHAGLRVFYGCCEHAMRLQAWAVWYLCCLTLYKIAPHSLTTPLRFDSAWILSSTGRQCRGGSAAEFGCKAQEKGFSNFVSLLGCNNIVLLL